MAIEHPRPTVSTVKELYGNAVGCARPECPEPLFTQNASAGRRTLNSRISHICARREGGPRWNPAMTADANRASENLLVLCLRHADEVDRQELIHLFPVSLLHEWKAQQVDAADAAAQDRAISDAEADEIIRRSDQPTIGTINAQVLYVGGLGGAAPGAAGGGGGAIGPGAIGGDGGSVGQILLDGQPGLHPGAGGGGGGVIAGSPEPSRDQLSGLEGEGFSDGVDGQAGGDTVVFAGDRELLRAAGGVGGRAGSGARSESPLLAVSCMMLTNYAEIRGGLVSAVGGGWSSFSVREFPSEMSFPLFLLIEAGGVEVGDYTLSIHILDPSGSVTARQDFPVTVERRGDVVRIPRCCTLVATVETQGVWTVVCKASDRELARAGLVVKRAPLP